VEFCSSNDSKTLPIITDSAADEQFQSFLLRLPAELRLCAAWLDLRTTELDASVHWRWMDESAAGCLPFNIATSLRVLLQLQTALVRKIVPFLCFRFRAKFTSHQRTNERTNERNNSVTTSAWFKNMKNKPVVDVARDAQCCVHTRDSSCRGQTQMERWMGRLCATIRASLACASRANTIALGRQPPG